MKLLRQSLILLLLISCGATIGHTRARYSNNCMIGNEAVTITGAGTSSTKWMISAPVCTVTAYLTGTLTLATLYANNSGTPLANPFTAAANGSFYFYADNGRYDVVMSGGGLATPVTIGDVFLIDTASLVTSASWSTLTAPSGNLALSMSTNTTTFTWGNMATTANSFSLTDGAASTSTGSLFRVFTGAASTMKPFTATAQGTSNGVQLSSAGSLGAIGTGAIVATDIVCTECITDSDINASGITTRSKLPAQIAYEDEANVFTQANVFNSTVGIKGGTAFTLTLGGTPTANRAVTIPDATSTLVNLSSSQQMSAKSFSDNLTFYSGTAFPGIFDHANSASRTWTMPDAAGTVLLAPSLTSGAIMYNNGTTLTQDPTVLFYNSTTKSVGIGNASPSASLHVQPRATASQVAMRVQGDSTANTDVLQVYNSAGSPSKVSFFASNGGLNTSVPIISTQTTGTAPFTIASTTVVPNLNVDSLDGGDWAIPPAIGSTTPNTGAFTTLTASTSLTSPIMQNSGDVADAGVIRLANADVIGWEASPAGTDCTLTTTSSEVLTSSCNASAPALVSTVSTGTAPLTITSTTPVSNLNASAVAYNAAGTQQTNGHVVFGTCILGTSCSVTLTGSAAFSSNSSYYCSATDMTSAAATKVVNTSASQVDFTGTGTDTLAYVCFGN